MALVTYLLGPCVGGPAILVDFDSSNLPTVNGNYYLFENFEPSFEAARVEEPVVGNS